MVLQEAEDSTVAVSTAFFYMHVAAGIYLIRTCTGNEFFVVRDIFFSIWSMLVSCNVSGLVLHIGIV